MSGLYFDPRVGVLVQPSREQWQRDAMKCITGRVENGSRKMRRAAASVLRRQVKKERRT
jgi:hypothetical protein